MKKLESMNKVTIKNKTWGGETVLACIPMVPKTKEDLLADAAAIAAMEPDVIEWRVDSFEQCADPEATVDALKAMVAVTGDIPVIFTLRAAAEGGAQELTEEQRLATITACLKTGLVDLIDTEQACNSAEYLKTVRELCTENHTALILSCHFFKATPDTQKMMDLLENAQKLGADIPKLAVMPQNFQDVLNLMSATFQCRTTGKVTQPMITMSMSETGKITRVIGDAYGSDMSFVLGKDASAPGQIPVGKIHQLWDLLA